MMETLPHPPHKQTALLLPSPKNVQVQQQQQHKAAVAPIIRQPPRLLRAAPRPRRTKAVIWCGAVCCIIFSLTLIVVGIGTLVVFLGVKPKHPLLDVTAARLNTIYLDTINDGAGAGAPQHVLNGDFTLEANLSNPNHKLEIDYDYLEVELYFMGRLIGTQAAPQPFRERQEEWRVLLVHMISSQVYLPLNHTLLLQKQVQTNRVRYEIKANVRVSAKVGGFTHVSYWLHSTCHLLLTAPPNGVLLARSCATKS